MAKHADIPEFGNLQGVKVVVSAVSTAGPFAGELFAENGADVIWLEPPRGTAGACRTSAGTCATSCSTSSRRRVMTCS